MPKTQRHPGASLVGARICAYALAASFFVVAIAACFGSDGSGGTAGTGAGATSSGGSSGGTTAGTSGGGAASGGGGSGTTIAGASGGATGGTSGGGTGGSGGSGAAGSATSSYDCTNCAIVCSLGSSSPCWAEYEGDCACAGGKDAGAPDPNLLTECQNDYSDTEAACIDACEPCCQAAGEDHGQCSYGNPGPWRCGCWSDPPPRGCQATGCPDGEECCDPGVPCSPSCAPIGKCPVCPYDCDSPDTPVATPDGDRPIAELREGDFVLSIDRGEVRAVPIVALRQHAVSDHHAVVRVVLASGRVIEISASHPTTDGGSLGALAPGDLLGDARVESVSMIPYAHAFTYDILPASDTGAYFAAGALVGSTLAVTGSGGER